MTLVKLFPHTPAPSQEEIMSYNVAGIDVHKRMLAVVVSDVAVDGEYHFERRPFGSNPEQLRSLAAWLGEREVEEVVMESTAQYWKPVWGALERLSVSLIADGVEAAEARVRSLKRSK